MHEEIFIVEDDTNLAELITLHLNDQGYATQHVADGLEVCKRPRRRVSSC